MNECLFIWLILSLNDVYDHEIWMSNDSIWSFLGWWELEFFKQWLWWSSELYLSYIEWELNG
jgi:hypothetical protein